MNQFSIRDVEMLSGIKAHTLRIWEQRHGFNFCKRKESQHRYYDNDDLKQILRISFLYHHGYKISKIAKLSQEQISDLTPPGLLKTEYDDSVDALVDFSLKYDEAGFSKLLDETFEKMGFELGVLKVVYPFLEKIGMLWMTNQIIPAQEHFSTNLIQKKFFCMTEQLPSVVNSPEFTTLIFAPAGEVHEIPLLVARHILRKHGILNYYMGVDVSLPDLIYVCKHRKITHLYFHLITNFQMFEPEVYLNTLLEELPGIKIIASGPVVNTMRVVPDKVKIVSSLEEVLRMKDLMEIWA
ncbi:MAG: MerR family transcriptional regulator [Chitinophagaceae bacterium]